MIYDEREEYWRQALNNGFLDHILGNRESLYSRCLADLTHPFPVTQRVKLERRLSWIRDRRACLAREAVHDRDTLESQFGELVARVANYHDKPHQLYSKLAVMVGQFHPSETNAYDNMMRQYEQVGPEKEAAREVERLREVVLVRDSTVESLSDRVHELEDEVACLRQALEPGPGPGVSEPGFVRIGRMDDANRRSLWLRERDGEIELRAGREGDDARVVVQASAFCVAKMTEPDEWQIPQELYRALSSIFGRARYAAENSVPFGQLEAELAYLQESVVRLQTENESLTDRLFTEEMRRYLESEQDPGDES